MEEQKSNPVINENNIRSEAFQSENPYINMPTKQPKDQNMAKYAQPVYPNTPQGNQYAQPVFPNASQGNQYAQPVSPNTPQGNQYVQPVNQYVVLPAQAVPSAYNNPYAPQIKPKRERKKGTKRDLIMAILLGITCYIMTDSFIWTGTFGLGFSIGAILFLIVEVWYIAPFIKKKSAYGVACILLITASAASLTFSADHFMKLNTVLITMMLNTCILMDSMDLRIWEPGSLRSIGDFYLVRYAETFGKIGDGIYGLFHREKKGESNKKSGVGKAFLGLLIALPLVALLIYLLYNADDAFRGMLDSIDFGKIPQRLLSIVLAIAVLILLFGRLFSLKNIRRAKREGGKGFDPIILTFILVGISVVYLAYLFSQLAYFFNGFMGFLPEDYTYAEYARRGFFELSTVGVINIIVLILCGALCRKKNGKLPLSLKLISLFLCVFSLVLIFTGFAKMNMYVQKFGLTRLRVLTTLFMLFLALIFVLLIVRIFVEKLQYMKIAVVICAVMVIATNFIGIDRTVAEYNINAYRSGKLEKLDIQTIIYLDDSATPYLIELTKENDSDIKSEAEDELYFRWRKLHEEKFSGYYSWSDPEIGELKPYDYKGFNLTAYRSREILLANEETIKNFR